MSANAAQPAALPPLKVTCTSTDCENGLHCYRATRRMRLEDRTGQCRTCGVQLVNWARIQRRDSRDAGYTFEMLRTEMIRHLFWHAPIDAKALAHATRKGRDGFDEAVARRLERAIGPEQPGFDGRQTPRTGNVIFYAQHATATCCRACFEEWHGIPRGTALSPSDLAYAADLVLRYIDERLPELPREGSRPRR